MVSEKDIQVKNTSFNSNAYNLSSFKIGFNAFSEDPDTALKKKTGSPIKTGGVRELHNPTTILEENNQDNSPQES